MTISATLAAIRDTWLTLSGDGQPSYRVDENGSPMTKLVMAQFANNTAKQYGVTYESNPYIAPDKPALAYA